MDKDEAIAELNKAINDYLERVSIIGGATRYWPKQFISEEMMDDPALYRAFVNVFRIGINTSATKEETIDERKHQASNVASVPKQRGRPKGTGTPKR